MRVATTVALLLIGIVLLVAALGLTGSSRLLPIAASGLLVILLGVQVTSELTSLRSQHEDLGRPGEAILWTLALPVAIALLGIVAGSAAYVTVYLKIRGAEVWWRCIVGGAAAAVGLSGLLTWLLRIDLPGGLLFG